MQIIDSHLLNDGKRLNDGSQARLIKIEDPGDFDVLVRNIDETGYYKSAYFETKIGYDGYQLKRENLPVASMAYCLNPRRVLELGCGRGDVLLLLELAGVEDVMGIDLSPDLAEHLPPELKEKVLVGDILDFASQMDKSTGEPDLVMAFDLWEHLHPARLDEYIKAVDRLASEDALFFFIVPAFGEDRVYGEPFPLQFEENRRDFDAGDPFTYLMAEPGDPPIPINGHLIWAPGSWWEAQFEQIGWVRETTIETSLHSFFDPYLSSAQLSFYLYRKGSRTAEQRTRALKESPMGHLHLWRNQLWFLRVLQAHSKKNAVDLMDMDELLLHLDDVALRMHNNQYTELHNLRQELNRLSKEIQILREDVQKAQSLSPKRVLGAFLPQPVKRLLKGVVKK